MKIAIARSAISSPTTLNLSNVSCRMVLPTLPIDGVASLWRIKAEVAQAFGLPHGCLESRRRPERIAWPRMIAMHLSSVLTGASASEIGEVFGRDHSTVCYAFRKVRERMESEPKAAKQVREILERIRTV